MTTSDLRDHVGRGDLLPHGVQRALPAARHRLPREEQRQRAQAHQDTLLPAEQVSRIYL